MPLSPIVEATIRSEVIGDDQDPYGAVCGLDMTTSCGRPKIFCGPLRKNWLTIRKCEWRAGIRHTAGLGAVARATFHPVGNRQNYSASRPWVQRLLDNSSASRQIKRPQNSCSVGPLYYIVNPDRVRLADHIAGGLTAHLLFWPAVFGEAPYALPARPRRSAG